MNISNIRMTREWRKEQADESLKEILGKHDSKNTFWWSLHCAASKDWARNSTLTQPGIFKTRSHSNEQLLDYCNINWVCRTLTQYSTEGVELLMMSLKLPLLLQLLQNLLHLPQLRRQHQSLPMLQHPHQVCSHIAHNSLLITLSGSQSSINDLVSVDFKSAELFAILLLDEQKTSFSSSFVQVFLCCNAVSCIAKIFFRKIHGKD